ncbi:MAG: hypothetical protein Q7T39_12510 [Polaromonas sp.]|nr:hypothetical protein [Polaromonas sp.]
MPVFHLLAGPNGAGKSTLYRALVRDGILSADLAFINADLFEREHLQHITDPVQRSQAARDWADAQRASKLAGGESFVSETVFSHECKNLPVNTLGARKWIFGMGCEAQNPRQGWWPCLILQRCRPPENPFALRVGAQSGDLPTKSLAWASSPCCGMLADNSSRLRPNATPEY